MIEDKKRIKVCSILEEYGISPALVPQSSLGAYGYETFAEKKPTGGFHTEYHEWPEGAWDRIQRVLNPEMISYPLTVEKLEEFGGPIVLNPAPGILAIVADYSNDTIDLTFAQAKRLHKRLGEILEEAQNG